MGQQSQTKSTPRARIAVTQLSGLKQLERVAGLLSKLHEVGCDRDKAGNRELHFDDYVLLNLLYLFNPLIDSMRTLQQVSELPEIQKRLGIERFSLGSFSESCRVFDGPPEAVCPLIMTANTPAVERLPSGRHRGKRMTDIL